MLSLEKVKSELEKYNYTYCVAIAVRIFFFCGNLADYCQQIENACFGRGQKQGGKTCIETD